MGLQCSRCSPPRSGHDAPDDTSVVGAKQQTSDIALKQFLRFQDPQPGKPRARACVDTSTAAAAKSVRGFHCASLEGTQPIKTASPRLGGGSTEAG
jgi:hypothetical protein